MKLLISSTMTCWAHNWKILFNPDPNKSAEEVLFSRKNKVQIRPAITLNKIQVEKLSHHKQLGIVLDENPNFKQDIDTAIWKINKGISVI